MLPLAAAGGGLTVTSVLANMFANSKVEKARDAALAAERQRQAGFDAENLAFNTGAQDRYTDFGGQQAKRGVELGDYFAAPPPTGGPAVALPAASSPLVANEITKQNGIAQNYGDQQAHALGNVRSFGDVLGGISRLQGRDANRIGQINSFKKGSSGVTELELEQAAHAGDLWKMIADISAGSGKAALTAGLSGGMTPAAPKTLDLSTGNPMWGGGLNGTNAGGWF